jgi:photosystem II stability/assembly factor-like uncharacterized protein
MKKKNFGPLTILSFPLLTFLIACTNDIAEQSVSTNPNGRNDNWGFVGPGGGGAMFHPSVSPHDPEFAFVSCDMTGSYVTYNGGESWRMFNLRGVNRFYVFDPIDPDVVYARSMALFRSTDRGNTWQVLYPDPDDITGIVSKGDHASEILITRDSTRRLVQALAIDPDNSEKLYAVIDIEGEVCLFISSDWGNTWIKELKLDEPAKNIFIDPSSPVKKRKIMITGSTSIIIVNGKEVHKSQNPREAERFTQYTAGYSKETGRFLIYAITGKSYFDPDGGKSGIYLSDDYGRTWRNIQDDLISRCHPGSELPEWRAIATCQSDPEVVYVSYADFRTSEDSICIGTAKSGDAGKTWMLAWKDKANQPDAGPGPNFDSGWLNDRFGPGWGENPFDLAVAPGNPDICFGTDFGRTVKTTDGGKNWEQVYTRKNESSGWISTGLQVTTNYMLAFDPFDSAHILMANTDTGMLQSEDGGESWSSATHNNGVPRPWYNSTYWIVFDPEVKKRIWTVMSRNHDLPRPKMWRRLRPDQYMGGVLISNDGAKSWNAVSDDIGEAAMTHILLDPESDADARTLYACAFGKGVYKSVDGGLNWEQKNNGIYGNEPFAWRITRRNNDGTLFLVVSRRSSDGSIENEGDGALYRSSDGAESWDRMTLPEGTNGPTSILADPANLDRVLLSAWGRPTEGKFTPDVGGGIFISEDDGATWRQVMKKDQHIHDITMDPRNDVFYACGFNASAYRSEDRGVTWQRIRGYNFKWGKRVEPDPLDPKKIYIITFGGGVWHGPAKGDLDAREDIITESLSYGYAD